MSPETKRAISLAYRRSGNAAQVARDLGLKPGTVRAYLRSRGKMLPREPGTSRTTLWRRKKAEESSDG